MSAHFKEVLIYVRVNTFNLRQRFWSQPRTSINPIHTLMYFYYAKNPKKITLIFPVGFWICNTNFIVDDDIV